MAEFKMPSLGADMDAGTLVTWRIKPGDKVKRGDIVADVETQKGVIEVEIWQDGMVDHLLIPEGEKVPVGTVLALLHGEGEAPMKRPEAAPAAPPQKVSGTLPAAAPAAPQKVSGTLPGPGHHVRASPAAKKRAEALGVDLSTITGSGPNGAIGIEDVEKAAAAKAQPKAAGPSGMRQAIAAAMARSKREIPHYYLSSRIDLSATLAWLERANAGRPVTERMLHIVLLLKAVAKATKEVPGLNGFYVDGAFRPAAAAHVGVAISLRGGGLVTPALHDVGDKTPDVLMKELTELIVRTRTGALRSSDLADGTITVTQLSEPGVDSVFGVIYPPQVAIVGFGQPVRTPVATDNQVVIRPMVSVTLAADHRVTDGQQGARFLTTIDRLLQTPEAL